MVDKHCVFACTVLYSALPSDGDQRSLAQDAVAESVRVQAYHAEGPVFESQSSQTNDFQI